MATEQSTTRWRDEAMVPQDYGNIATLVGVARKARGRIVEFDWAFTRDDLCRLGRAVYEWGKGVTGRYRYFDARVLAAINHAIGDTGSIYVLNEPKSDAPTECKASCVGDGDLFRLQGHAPFDIVFGYGSAGVDEKATWSVYLGPTVRETLATAVGMLGWDLRRLQEEPFRPVRNVLYGLPMNYGPPPPPPPPPSDVRVTDLPVHFQGPFSAFDDDACRCLFAEGIGDRSGVYLWTVGNLDGAQWPWYVGQTRRSFAQRMGEHVANMLSGQYTPMDPDALCRGRNLRLAGAAVANWPGTIPAFLRNAEKHMSGILRTIRLLRFHVASLEGDAHLHDRVEGALGRYYKNHPVTKLRDFFSPGLSVPAAIPGDQPLRLKISTEAQIAGLPLEILEPAVPLPAEIRQFVDRATWTFAKTYAPRWPHEYILKTAENAQMLLALAGHIFQHGVAGRFYSQVRRYHHENGKVYWSMDDTPETTTLINRCDEAGTYESRMADGTLPSE